MIFPKGKRGDLKSGNKFELGRAPLREKCFLIFLGQENTKNDYLSLMHGNFIFRSRFWLYVTFLDPNIHSHSKKNHYESEPLTIFLLFDDMDPSCFGFSCVDLFLITFYPVCYLFSWMGMPWIQFCVFYLNNQQTFSFWYIAAVGLELARFKNL